MSHLKIAKPRIRKGKPPSIHVGAPFKNTGWKCETRWAVVARRERLGEKETMGTVRDTLFEARATSAILLNDWDSVEIKEEEVLL